ncbi:MAG: homoserine kinase [Patescibacteria group bacterium]
MSSKSLKIFAPATVANVACGFDVLGFAVNEPGDEMILTLKTEPGVIITKITGDNGRLPLDPKKNTAGVAVLAYLKHIRSDQGVEIEIHKKMPLGSGLGSSAASAVGGVFGINELLDRPLKKEELLPFAMEGERAACGFAHADNVAPSLLGGMILIRSYEPLEIIPIPTPPNLFCALVHPDFELRTADSRKVLKKEIELKDAVIQWGNVGGLIAGLMKSDYGLIGRSLQDVVAEPRRAPLIPGFFDVKNAALKAGALGCSISGSGPSIFALSQSLETAKTVGEKMQAAFSSQQINSEIYISPINRTGVKII